MGKLVRVLGGDNPDKDMIVRTKEMIRQTEEKIHNKTKTKDNPTEVRVTRQTPEKGTHTPRKTWSIIVREKRYRREEQLVYKEVGEDAQKMATDPLEAWWQNVTREHKK